MKHALIIGSGIAGPVAAIALQQAGISSTVYEAYQASDGLSAGVFLTVAVNGLGVLRSLDLHSQVLAAGFPSRTIEFISGSGKPLGIIPMGGTLPDGTVTHTIKRADLYRIVSEEAASRGISFVHQKRLVFAENTPTGVVAHFEDGSSATGDLLIGADGIHSKTRQLIDPGAPTPRYTGLGNIGGFCRTERVLAAPGTYQMIFGRRCFFGYAVSPSGEIWWFANPPSKRALSRGELSSLSSEAWKERLCALFSDDKTPSIEIIQATKGGLFGTNQYDLPHVPIWHRGRMVILGDAAHAASPSSGQGVSMAVEDALVLAKCLRDIPEVERAFFAFEGLRRARVERVVAYGAKNSSSKTAGPIGRFFRDLMLPFVLKKAARAGTGSLSWLFDYHVDWKDAVGAPTNP